MQLSPSAHVDTFCRDNLPPAEQWPELEFTLPALAYPNRLNCADALLDDTIATHGTDRACLLPQDQSQPAWSYGDLARTASQIAAVLTTDLGLVPGNRVLLRGPNTAWLVACWLGVVKAGGVVVATMAQLRAAELAAICDITQVRLAICDHRFTDELTAAGVPGLTMITYSDTGPTGRGPAGGQAAAADDVALIAFTSGTTGRPKAAMHFHRDVLAVADTFSAYVLRPKPDDIFTGTPPLAFTFGLGALLIFPLRAEIGSTRLNSSHPSIS